MTGRAKHGTVSRYTGTERCRCAKCRKAFATYMRGYRARRRQTGVGADVEHGTISTYNNWLCRCIECRAAMSADNRARRGRAADD